MKKFFNSVLAAALALTLVAGPAFAKGEAEFSDVAGIDEEVAILKLHALGAIQGYVDGDYHPEDELTRAQFAVILARALGQEKLAQSLANQNIFPDTATGYDWAKGAINLAASKGWITGYPNGNFGPADSLTDEQMITILVRAVGAKVEASEPWYVGYMLKAADLDILYGAIEVGSAATRAKAAQSVLNMLEVPVTAGDLDIKEGVARVESIKGEITAVSSTSITVKYEDKTGASKNITFNNIKDIPVYGDLKEKATVEVIVKGNKAVMAFVHNTTKTLAVVKKGKDYVEVSENGENVIYYVAEGKMDDILEGYYYDFVFNSDGEIIAFEENAKAGSGIITAWKRSGDTYKITAGGKEYTFAADGKIERLTYVGDEEVVASAGAKTVANAWGDLKVGDKLVITEFDGSKIKTAYVFASSVTATVDEVDGNFVTLAFKDADVTVDVRHRDFRDIEIKKGDDVIAWADLEEDMEVTVKLNVADITYDKDDDEVAGSTKIASLAVDKAADIEKKIITAVEVDHDGVITLTVDGKSYALAKDAKVDQATPAAGAPTNEYNGDKTTLTAFDFLTEATIKDGKITAAKAYRHTKSNSGDAVTTQVGFDENGDIERKILFGSNPYTLAADYTVVKADDKAGKLGDVAGSADVTIHFNSAGKVFRIKINPVVPAP